MTYYEALGLDQKTNPSMDDIKKAYRKKVVTDHPDKGGSNEKFRAVQEAYETLSHPDKRLIYDRQFVRPSFAHIHPSFGGPSFFQGPPPPMPSFFFNSFAHPYTEMKAAEKKPKRTRWTSEEDTLLLSRIKDGYGQKRIGELMGRSASSISYRLRSLAVDMHKKGKTFSEIETVTRVKQASILKFLEKGLKR